MVSDRTSCIGGLLLAAAFALVALSLASATAAAREVRSEYDVKAAIVYNILNFVEWPSNQSGQEELRICLAGSLPDAAPFLDLQEHAAVGRRLVVTYLGSVAPGECNVLFIAGQDQQQLRTALAVTRGRVVLVIAEQQGAAQEGAVVNLTIISRRVRFEINAGAGRKAGLKISSKLLKLASTVIDRETAGE